MKIILLEKIEKLGNKNEKVNVKAGYARNYLLPKQKAILATTKNLEKLKNEEKKQKQKISEKIIIAKNKIKKIKKIGMLVISSKSSKDGKFFGSIGVREIIKKLNSLGIKASKKEINLPNGPLRNIGKHIVLFKPHNEISTKFIINAIKE
ncbi:50S ribosomal protein L9 [Buchnera aphidicola (Taiwanaphis decaspermi)]|uniref:50S ribosomal protein L9 n=1 Tax=Buchnera aphidicola TaxID=9 RepID=UPI0031B864B6